MTYKTHIALAMLPSIPLAAMAYEQEPINILFFLAASVIGSLAPDLDEEGSYLSNKLPVFPMLFKLFGVKHRGITHRLIFVIWMMTAFLVFCAYENSFQKYSPFLYGFLLGYFMHLVGDMLTKGGINKFFYPFFDAKGVLLPRKFRFYTGSMNETFVLLFIALGLGIESYYIFGAQIGKLF